MEGRRGCDCKTGRMGADLPAQSGASTHGHPPESWESVATARPSRAGAESQRGPGRQRGFWERVLAQHVVVWDSTEPAVCLRAGVTWRYNSSGLPCVFSAAVLFVSRVDS